MDDKQRKAMFAKLNDNEASGAFGSSILQNQQRMPTNVRDYKLGHIIKTVRERNNLGSENDDSPIMGTPTENVPKDVVDSGKPISSEIIKRDDKYDPRGDIMVAQLGVDDREGS